MNSKQYLSSGGEFIKVFKRSRTQIGIIFWEGNGNTQRPSNSLIKISSPEILWKNEKKITIRAFLKGFFVIAKK